jgi:hypothetical protein
MSRLFRIWVLMLGVVLVSACTPAPEAIPTLVVVPTLEPTSTLEPTATATRIPRATSTPTLPAPQTTNLTSANQAFLRVVHASPEIAAVDFFVDGLEFSSFMEYGFYTEPTPIINGTFTLRVLPNGVGDINAPIVSTELRLTARTSTVVVLAGTSTEPRLIVYVEDTSPIERETTRVTLVNARPTSPTVSILNASEPLISDVQYGRASLAINLPSAEIALNVRSDGNILYTDNLTLRQRRNYSLIVTNSPDNPAEAQVISFTTQLAGTTRVNVINTIDPSNLRVMADNVVIGENLGYLYRGDAIEVPSGDYTLEVFNRTSADPNSPSFSTQINFVADQSITLVFMGTNDNVQMYEFELDERGLDRGFSRLTVLNAASNTTEAIFNTNNIETTIGFGQTYETELPSGDYDFIFSGFDNGTILSDAAESIPQFRIEESRHYLYVYAGRDEQDPIFFAQTVDTLPPTPAPEDLLPPPTPVVAPEFYFINAIEGFTVDVLFDESPIYDNVPFASGTGILSVSAGTRTIFVRRADNDQLLARLTTEMLPSNIYTFVVYGTEITGYNIFLATEPNSVFEDPTTTVRLINISQTPATMGLSLAIASGEQIPFPGPVVAPVDGAPPPTYRTSLTLGLTNVFSQIGINASSNIINSPIRGETVDIYVLDNDNSGISNIIPNYIFQEGVHYDVVATQEAGSLRVSAFVVGVSPR